MLYYINYIILAILYQLYYINYIILIILYCIISYCIILYYVILYYVILCYIILYYIILYYFILFYFILFYFILFYQRVGLNALCMECLKTLYQFNMQFTVLIFYCNDRRHSEVIQCLQMDGVENRIYVGPSPLLVLFHKTRVAFQSTTKAFECNVKYKMERRYSFVAQ